MIVLALLSSLLVAAPSQAKTFNIDPDHSSVNFRIRHLGSKVSGSFRKVSGKFSYDAKDTKAWSAEAEIDPASIDTNNEKRDGHLKSPDFFDVAKCPKMTFKSTKVGAVKGKKATLAGDLTMHCVTKPVTLALEISDEQSDPWGNNRVGATATTTIHRKDFDVSWNKTLDKGGLMLGDDVEVTLGIEGVQSKEEQKETSKGETKAKSDVKPAEKPAEKK